MEQDYKRTFLLDKILYYEQKAAEYFAAAEEAETNGKKSHMEFLLKQAAQNEQHVLDLKKELERV